MAFWGIEIKPTKPYTHRHDSTRGRLRISQVTLGDGKAREKSTLQCNVGNKSPILLCRLTPDVSETCHLALEFEEDDEVVFSVLGQRSVHLSGYFVGLGRDTGGNDTDSYGEDITHSDSDDANFYASISEDEYESDFIDDDDINMLPESPQRKSGVVIEEIVDDEKPTNENGNRRRLKKKKTQVVDSDEGNLESQVQPVKGTSATVDSEDEDGFPVSVSLKKKDADNIVENAKTDATVDEDRKRKICDILDDPEPKKVLDASQPESGDLSTEKPKKKKKLKDRKPVEKDFVPEVKSEEEAKEEPNGDANTGNMDEDAPSSVEPDNDKVEMDHSPLTTSGKLKKKNKKKKLKDVTVSDGDQENTEDNVDTTDGEQKKSEDSDQELPKDESNEQEAKKKRKKKKNKKVVEDANDQLVEEKVAEGMDEPKPSKIREFSNGLIIEDVSMGRPDGKRATPGSKVSVHYTGKLKQNGKVFDASRRKPFVFRLGIGEVIKGWDVGVNGMRIGDKRRLIIPPSMGYGNKVTGVIPANSWLVFDVVLVEVK